MTLTNQIPRERWLDFCATFSNGNRGRLLSIEVHTDDQGDNQLVTSVPLIGIAYDPPEKGNDIVVTIGHDEEEEYVHRIPTPTEVRESQADNGQVTKLEIIDQNNSTTTLSF